MKNKLTILCLFASSAIAFSQNTFPSTGNVGIGTLSPSSTAKLDILANGTTRSFISANKTVAGSLDDDFNFLDLKMSLSGGVRSNYFKYNTQSQMNQIGGGLTFGGSYSGQGGFGYSYDFSPVRMKCQITGGSFFIGKDLISGTSFTGMYLPNGNISGNYGLKFHKGTTLKMTINDDFLVTTNNFTLNTDGSFAFKNGTTELMKLNSWGGLNITGRYSCTDAEINMEYNPTTGNAIRPFMGRDFSQTKTSFSGTKHWLVINPGAWDANIGARKNDYDGGTLINSKLVISTGISWYDATAPHFESNALLSVDGLIYSEGLRCKLSQDWGDYVFAKDYKLNSLENVETYINENHHLPGIPSAEEVKENGLELENMQVMQMVKIEEHTLYLIEQNKKIEDLISENKSLLEQNEVIVKKIEELEKLLNSK